MKKSKKLFPKGSTMEGVKLLKEVVAHTGLEPVVSALRGQRVSRLHQCAVAV
jgi:hypothetical protein